MISFRESSVTLDVPDASFVDVTAARCGGYETQTFMCKFHQVRKVPLALFCHADASRRLVKTIS